MNYRIQGLFYYEIAQKMKVSETRARQLVEDGMKRAIEEPARELRIMQYDRLTKMWRGVEPGIEDGDPASIQAGVRIVQQVCKLFGVEAPAKHEVTGKDGKPLSLPAPVLERDKLGEIVTALMQARAGDVVRGEKKPSGNGD